MPTTSDLVRLQKKYEDEKVTIVAIYAASSSQDAFKRHAKSKQISYSAIYDRDNRIGQAYGITDVGLKSPVTPTFLLGADGKVLWEQTQLRHWPKSIATLEALIDKKLKKSK